MVSSTHSIPILLKKTEVPRLSTVSLLLEAVEAVKGIGNVRDGLEVLAAAVVATT